jgi:hypothetical protein
MAVGLVIAICDQDSQPLRKVPQRLGESAHWGEKFKLIRRSLGGTVIAEIVPEVRVLFF